jgi:hypothetical protein
MTRVHSKCMTFSWPSDYCAANVADPSVEPRRRPDGRPGPDPQAKDAFAVEFELKALPIP